jgi:hypothetical protein
MKVFQMADVLHEYLVHIVEKHGASGIHPEEGLALSKVWEAVTKNVTHIDDAEVRKMAAAGAPPSDSAHVHSPTDPHIPGEPCDCEPEGTNYAGPR